MKRGPWGWVGQATQDHHISEAKQGQPGGTTKEGQGCYATPLAWEALQGHGNTAVLSTPTRTWTSKPTIPQSVRVGA